MSAQPQTLYLVRHGQTDANVRMALDAAPPGGPLTAQGRQQALDLAGSFADVPLVAVYASTALRAQQTAEPVAAGHGLDVSVLDGIHEVGVGELQGRTDKDAAREFFHTYAAWVAGDLDRPMPGGETAKQVLTRYTEAVSGIRAAHPEGAVLLVSHGAVIRLVAPALADNVQGELGEHALLPNTGRVVLEAGDMASPYHCVEWTGVHLD